ncbi:MAG: hypothetical protein P4L36_17230 [Holophaga sp.]|nr:hypothetical protein [Holophaga sp.]
MGTRLGSRALPAMVLIAAGLLPGASARAAHTLARGASLQVGDCLTSSNGRFQMVVLPHGKIAIYPVQTSAPSRPTAPGGPILAPFLTPIWESDNAGGLEGIGALELREDNNLVLTDTLPDGRSERRWESGTAGRGAEPATLVLDDHGILHLYSAWISIWSTPPPVHPSVPGAELESKASPVVSASDATPPPAPGPVPAPPGFSVGGGSSKVTISLAPGTSAPAGPEGSGAPLSFSVGGGSSKVNISIGQDGKDCVVM